MTIVLLVITGFACYMLGIFTAIGLMAGVEHTINTKSNGIDRHI